MERKKEKNLPFWFKNKKAEPSLALSLFFTQRTGRPPYKKACRSIS
jgi:hypothetical protein